jgi:ABC-type multidrug transport system ATPase subunit
MSSLDALSIRQEILYNSEGRYKIWNLSNFMILTRLEDIHFPTLTVQQTIKFALRNKEPHKAPEDVAESDSKFSFIHAANDKILKSLGIHHTADTLVGNEFVRGVSGGERKRVSIAEVMSGHVCALDKGNEI